MEKTTLAQYPASLKIWLLIGLVMVFFQVVIGGVTRLTGSGLSITKWEIVTGTLPPLGEAQWEEAFALYKATPQYQKINEGMTLPQFKFIYFWEYLHRLWARLMGFVFAIPFFIFWRKGWIDRVLMRKLAVVVGLAALAAAFGWIMVASGLVNRPWVNGYKLTLHLSLAILVFAALLWTVFWVYDVQKLVFHNLVFKKWTKWFLVLISVQILLGGLMSGMKAALVYPTWPDMHGSLVPAVLFEKSNWTWQQFVHYDSNPFVPALVQFFHRLFAYLLTISGLWFFFKNFKSSSSPFFQKSMWLFALLLLTQVLLGIFTLISSKGIIPVGLGVLHQGFAILLLGSMLLLYFQATGEKGR